MFAKFNLPQHLVALRSNKREVKGRSALKATVEDEDRENRRSSNKLSLDQGECSADV